MARKPAKLRRAKAVSAHPPERSRRARGRWIIKHELPPGEHTVERSKAVLLLIDVINDFEFPEGRKLLKHALQAAVKISVLKKHLHQRRVPAVYVNDNFGRWRSDFKAQVERCISSERAGAAVARMLVPGENDYFVLKPKHSGFYASSLNVLLAGFGAQKLIITGFAADICVLYTANDAYMRGYQIAVPRDCVAAESVAAKRYALEQMERFLHADVRSSRALG